MDNLNIDERIRDTKQLVRESETLMNRSLGGHELKQEMLDKLRIINLETLQEFTSRDRYPPKEMVMVLKGKAGFLERFP